MLISSSLLRRWWSWGLSIIIILGGSLSRSVDSGLSFLGLLDDALDPFSTLSSMRRSAGQSTHDSVASRAIRSRPMLLNVTSIDFPVPDLGHRHWYWRCELSVGRFGLRVCGKLPCKRWCSTIELSWHWLLWTSSHAAYNVRCPPLSVGLPLNVRDPEDTSRGTNETLSRSHVESQIDTIVPLILELPRHCLRFGNLEQDVLPKFRNGSMGHSALHHLQ